MPNSQVAIPAPIMPRRMLVIRPMLLRVTFSASQPATAPIRMAAIQPMPSFSIASLRV
jgi:hypothetical protein